MKHKLIKYVTACLLGLASTVTVASAKTITGQAYVVDGDTIHIPSMFGKYKIRFDGVDAPETKQTCVNADGQNYNCGTQSTEYLRSIVGSNEVTCVSKMKDRYKRYIATCYVDGDDLSLIMVRKGHARAYVRYSKKYLPAENIARQEKLGIWQGEHTAPWTYRKQ